MTDTERQAAGFRVVAILAIRYERPYLANCLDYLIADGLDYFIIDNESDDGTAELLREPRFAAHLVGYQSHAADRFTFPETAELEYLGDRASHELSRDRPRKRHYWQW